eukprot:scaffold44907_cov64-Phaeocystis_antarctica.AAC.3
MIRPVVTEASGAERDGPVDRRQYGIESPVSSVIEVLKWSLALSHSDSQFAPHSGWTHRSEGGSIRDERERGGSNGCRTPAGAEATSSPGTRCFYEDAALVPHCAQFDGRSRFSALTARAGRSRCGAQKNAKFADQKGNFSEQRGLARAPRFGEAVARGENLLRSRRVVARDARWGVEPAEWELALRRSPCGPVGVHNVVESSVGVREGGELKRALDAHELAERLEHGRVVGREVVVIDDKQLLAGPVLGPGPHLVFIHANHHVQGRRVDPQRLIRFVVVSVVGVPEVLNARAGIPFLLVVHPEVNFRRRFCGEYVRVRAGRPLIVPRQHPLRRLAQDGDHADVWLQIVRHESAKKERCPSVGQQERIAVVVALGLTADACVGIRKLRRVHLDS